MAAWAAYLFRVLVPLILLLGVVPASAETWKARNKNIVEGAPAACLRAHDGLVYIVDLEGDKFTLSGDNGKFFTITVPSDGAVKHEFKSPNGGRFEVTGNVRSRDLVFKNLGSACSSRLVPM